MHNTWAGASHNGPRHNKGDTTNGDLRFFVRGNLFRSRSISGDYSKSKTWTNGEPSPRVDNWPSRFGVGEQCNYTYDPARPDTFGFEGNTTADIPSWGSFYARPLAADFPGFIKDASAGSSNDHVGGDYHLVDDSTGANHIAKVPRLPALVCAYSVDIYGCPVPLDGTALARALQLRKGSPCPPDIP